MQPTQHTFYRHGLIVLNKVIVKTGLFHIIVILRPDREIGDVLQDEPDLYALLRFTHQKLFDRFSSLIIAELEILHVDVFLCLKYVLAQQFELAPSLGDDLEIISTGDGRISVPAHQTGQKAEVLSDE